MVLKLYNTLSRQLEEFKPHEKGIVKMYSCGPTVYNYVHIGNLRAYVFVDLLRRYLKYKGFRLNHVMNITDIDDKTIRDSQKEGKSLKEFTEYYTGEFLKDLNMLNIEIPEHMPKATETIPEMITLIKILLKKEYAYKTENGDIYFSISKFKDYGKLALIDPEKLKQNADGRLNKKDEYEKEDARDFALWKAWDENDGNVFWETELGKGRPGWHIECSVMSENNLNIPFDIHTGGVDLIFPHHTNEIAQTEAAYNEKMCNYWVHNEHLLVNGEKMSKSLNNFYTLRDLIKKNYNPAAIRFELLSTHYRQKLDFREANLKNIPNTLNKIYNFLDKLDDILNKNIQNKNDDSNCDSSGVIENIEKYKKKFEESMDNDLNISGGIAAVFEFMNEINKIEICKNEAVKIKEFMNNLDSVLGIMKHEITQVPSTIQDLAQKRWDAKQNKDWDLSDKIRDELKEEGFVIEDSKDGFKVKKL